MGNILKTSYQFSTYESNNRVISISGHLFCKKWNNLNFKNSYLIFLILLLFIFTILRWEYINQEKPYPLDIIIISFLFVLFLSPIFTEINILGIEVKREIKKLKKDVSKSSFELREAFLNLQQNITNSAISSSNINFYGDGRIPSEKKMDKVIQKKKNESEMYYDIPQNLINAKVEFLAKTKIWIENYVRRIYRGVNQMNLGIYGRPRSPLNIISYLSKINFFTLDFTDDLLGILSICAKGIDSQAISDKEIDYIRSMSGEVHKNLQEKLNSIPKEYLKDHTYS